MNHWKSLIDTCHPCWRGYRELIARLDAALFPEPGSLIRLLPPGTFSLGGAAVRFVPADRLPDVQYERHIFETGEVSTRKNNWHDLFNALVWCRLPRTKAAMNSLHYRDLDRELNGRRGKLRDALTLLDESGVIVVGSNLPVLEALAGRDWQAAYVTHRAAWNSEVQVLICGHSILEKFLKPYKSMTAHALILHAQEPVTAEQLDILLADALVEKGLAGSPASLSPLPLMGIPGWWSSEEQNQVFYADRDVFRPAPRRMAAAPIHRLKDLRR